MDDTAPTPGHRTRELVQRFRNKLDAGFLPTSAPEKTLAGSGSGQPCDGCDEPIEGMQAACERSYADGRTLRFHLGCAGLYEMERRDYAADRPRPSRADAPSGARAPLAH